MSKPIAYFFLFFLLNGCREKEYVPPNTKKAGIDGWQEYLNSPIYKQTDCKKLFPKEGSPESAVVNFLSSRARGDDKFISTVIDKEDWDIRLQKRMLQWSQWEVLQFQLRRKKYFGDQKILIEAMMEIKAPEESNEGVGEFELVKNKESWLIQYPPN